MPHVIYNVPNMHVYSIYVGDFSLPLYLDLVVVLNSMHVIIPTATHKYIPLSCSRDCFFTMKDARSKTFIQALNESLESGTLMCQLYNAELNKHIMNLTNEFCWKQLELGVPKVSYVKKAAERLGRQLGSQVWVLNNIHLNADGEHIPINESEYIWLGAMTNVAPALDAATIPLQFSPLRVHWLLCSWQ